VALRLAQAAVFRTAAASLFLIGLGGDSLNR
jgi:hypothetical protein